MCGSGGGKCEERMGRWLRARNIARSEVVLVSKGGCEGQDKLWAATCGDENSLKHDLEGSLHRLGVEYIDCYLLHRDDPSTPVEKIVDLMDSIVRSGCIHSWGVSNWQLPRLAAALDYSRRWGKAAPVADSPQNSLAEPSRAVWPNTSFLTAERRPLWREITRGEVAMLGWESLAKGFMCGKWSRADSEDFFEVALDEDNGAVWREMQLRRAYCDGPHNFDRRDRALELAAQKGATLPEIALGMGTPCAHSALKNSKSLPQSSHSRKLRCVPSVRRIRDLTVRELVRSCGNDFTKALERQRQGSSNWLEGPHPEGLILSRSSILLTGTCQLDCMNAL